MTKSKEKIELIYSIHEKDGFKGVVEFFLDYMDELLHKYPDKPTIYNKEAVAEFDFLYEFMNSKDKNWISPMDKVSKDWLNSGYCDICFTEVLRDFYDYMDFN